MNNALDPIKIVMCGGHGVGKTTLLKRLAGMPFPADYDKTSGVNEFTFQVPLDSGVRVKLTVVDVGAQILQTQRHNLSIFTAITLHVDAAILVVDCTSAQSMKESDSWLDFLTTYIGENHPGDNVSKFLLAHKADLPLESRIISASSLDNFVRLTGMRGWAYTVGHAELSDMDLTRGTLHRQKAPHDVLRQLVIAVLVKRQSNLYKLIPAVMRLEFVGWRPYAAADLDVYTSSQACT